MRFSQFIKPELGKTATGIQLWVKSHVNGFKEVLKIIKRIKIKNY